MKNIAFAWGWTGWHVLPIKNLIDYIISKNNLNWKIKEIYWFWEKTWLEKIIFDEIQNKNTHFINIYAWKLRREFAFNSAIKNIFDCFKFIFWFFQCFFYLIYYKIDIIFCKWWFIALPVVIAWFLLMKKIVVHESDTVPWLTNKISSNLSQLNFCWFPNVLKKGIFVWQILSEQLNNFKQPKLHNISKDFSKTNLLLIWWSQWAYTIYSVFLNILNLNKRISQNFNIFIVLWTKNIEFKEKLKDYKNIEMFEFLNQNELWYLYNICDIWITRWWATSLEEQKIFWLKLIIIPLPYTWWNHQYFNWLYYQKTYWDIVLNQNKNLEWNLSKSILNFIWFKKEEYWYQKINSSKKIICENLDKIF